MDTPESDHPNDEYDAFEDLAKKLIAVPKSEVDELREAEKQADRGAVPAKP